MGLLIVVLVLAALGGFLGELLEFAFWAIVVMAVVAGIIGFFLYRGFQRLKQRFS